HVEGALSPAFLDNVAAASAWLVAMITVDIDALLTRSAEDIEFHAPGSPALPGRFAGKSALAERTLKIQRGFPIRGLRIVGASRGASDEEVILVWESSAVQRDGEVAHGCQETLVRVHDGLVSYALNRSAPSSRCRPADNAGFQIAALDQSTGAGRGEHG